MKLSKKSSVRVLIRKQGARPAHITLEDTTIPEAVDYLKSVLRRHVDPFAEGRVTSITVSKAKVNGSGLEEADTTESSVTFSFKGMEPSEVKLIVVDSFSTAETTP